MMQLALWSRQESRKPIVGPMKWDNESCFRFMLLEDLKGRMV